MWTQITDVEKERNGLLTYDRSKFKEDPIRVAALSAILMDRKPAGQ